MVTLALLVLWTLGILAGTHLTFWLQVPLASSAVETALRVLRRRRPA